jgi:hypothetical protein
MFGQFGKISYIYEVNFKQFYSGVSIAPHFMRKTIIMKINVFKQSVYEEWVDVVSKTEMYLLYIWSFKGREIIMSKIGERWVNVGESVLESIYDRIINGSFGQSTDKVEINRGNLVIHAIIDVSEFAKSVGKFKQKSHIDDYICRSSSGIPELRRSQDKEHEGTEHHNIDPEYAEELIIDYIRNNNCSIKELECGTVVGETAIKVLNLLDEGHKHIAGELATRFRKTLFGGILTAEMGWDLLIVTSYVKTVATSYFTQLKKYKVFSNDKCLFIDLGVDTEYKNKINDAIKSGKKVIAYISANKGSKRDERYEFIYKKCKSNRATIIEEPDFGVWRKGQVEPITKYHSKNEIVLILGGTNIDRAVIHWPKTKMVSVPYIDLEIQKRLTKEKLGI